MVAITSGVSAPITLNQYAQTLEQASPTRTFVENMVAESDVMRAIPWLPATAGKRAFMDIGSLPATGFRNINAPGNEQTGSFNLREEDTFFIDEYIKVDRALIDRLGDEHRYKQEKLKSTALSQMFSSVVLKGDNGSNPAQPNGLQVRCNNLGYNLVYNSASSGGGALSLTNLDQLYWLVNKPTHWIMPRGLMPFWDAAARNASLVNQSVVYAEDPDFGHRVIKFKGLPILFGYEPDDTPDLLPFSEVAAGGGAAVTGSVYCVSFRDGGIYAIEQTALSVMDEGMLIGAPFHSTHIKWDWGIAREHPRSAARLSSVTNAALVA